MTPPGYLTEEGINKFIDDALSEDIGDGDHSSLAVIGRDQRHSASLLVKENGVVAGLELAGKIFHRFDPELEIEFFKTDGDAITKGDFAFRVKGRARSILSTERLVLNCMQRMSGIATYTRRLGRLIEGTKARLMDTRKTTPNFRMMEKWAVAIGGGLNHRFALYDMVMLKDNHVDLAGGVENAILTAKNYLSVHKPDLKIEVETRNLMEVIQALRVGGIDVIMLDNMSLADMKEAVRMVDGKCRTEASGGITEDILRAVADCGVDYISIGALTHSVKSLDLSLKVDHGIQ